jgi:uncharacterized protein (TIGR02271 family)
VQEQVTLRTEHVDVERRPVNQPLTGALNDDLLRERTIELTETSEEAVVAKEARVVEEVLVHKNVEQRTENIQDTVRHTEVMLRNCRAARTPTAVKAFRRLNTVGAGRLRASRFSFGG